jgi:hypothetical protein
MQNVRNAEMQECRAGLFLNFAFLQLSFQPSAFSHQLSAISFQPSAFSYQLSAISFKQCAFLHSCIPHSRILAFLHSCIPAFLHSCIPAFLHSWEWR